MRIVIVSSSFPRYIDDHAGIFVYNLAQHLVETGADVHVLAPADDTSSPKSTWDGINVHRFRYSPPGIPHKLCYGSGIPDNLQRSVLAWLQIPLYSARLPFVLKRLIDRERIDVVNSHWLLMQGVIGSTLKRWTGTPHVCTVHAGELSLLPRLPRARDIVRFTVSHADEVICVSEDGRRKLEQIAHQSITANIFPMGIDVQAFSANRISQQTAKEKIGATAQNTLLFVGRLAEKKGVDYLLRALPVVLDEFPDSELFIIGTGHLETKLRALTQEMSIEQFVRFTGRIPNSDLPLYYRASDLIVIPSIVTSDGNVEGMPVVLLEALAAGQLIVATPTGGIPELIGDGKNGFLVEPADVEALSAGIKRVLRLQNTDVARQIRQAARETALPFDWTEIANQYCNLFENAIR